jgi:N-acetylmuramoyl-L-alanine amidase
MRVIIVAKRNLLVAILPVLAACFAALFTFPGPALAGRTIVADAGHGGIDPGANRPGIQEKDINLAVTLALRDVLAGQGAHVVLTRETDSELSGLCDNARVRGRYHRDLHARREMIREANADFFISIHANASPHARRRGIECYYAADSAEGKALALAIQEQLGAIAPVSQQARPAEFYVLRRSKVPAVLIEVGFITNPDERALLQSPEYQRRLAEAIAAGVAGYVPASRTH